jgi:hypothetical protein
MFAGRSHTEAKKRNTESQNLAKCNGYHMEVPFDGRDLGGISPTHEYAS